MIKEEILQELFDSVLNGEVDKAKAAAERSLEEGISPCPQTFR